MNNVAVIATSPRMLALAERFGLPYVIDEAAGGEVGATLWLRESAQGIELGGDVQMFGNPIRADFVEGRAAHRRQFGGGRGQMIAKACGVKQGVAPRVVDATAGLGRDGFVLATLGCTVLLIERVGAIAALLEDALTRAHEASDTAAIAARMMLVHGDSAAQLEMLISQAQHDPQVIHLDPMFPHRDKRALVKKEMRLFRELAGDDNDAPRLLEAALDVATHRVVVKRPRLAPAIVGPRPSHVIEGKTSRYDVYVHRALR